MDPESRVSQFANFLLTYNWAVLTDLDVDQMAIVLESTLKDGLNYFLPTETKVLSANSNDWYTKNLARLKEQKSKEFIKNGRSEEYFSFSKKYDSELSSAKAKFKQKHIDEARDAANPRALFRALRKLAGIEENRTPFILPGHEYKSAKEVADILAQFFSTISQE